MNTFLTTIYDAEQPNFIENSVEAGQRYLE